MHLTRLVFSNKYSFLGCVFLGIWLVVDYLVFDSRNHRLSSIGFLIVNGLLLSHMTFCMKTRFEYYYCLIALLNAGVHLHTISFTTWSLLDSLVNNYWILEIFNLQSDIALRFLILLVKDDFYLFKVLNTYLMSQWCLSMLSPKLHTRFLQEVFIIF